MKDLAKRLGDLFRGDPEEHDWCGTLQRGPLGLGLPRGPRPPAPSPSRPDGPPDMRDPAAKDNQP